MKSFTFISALTVVLGCSGSDKSSFDVTGAVEKGPFVQGSTVTISPLNSEFQPTGQVFTTQTIDNEGRFEVTITDADFVSIEGNGFYYNEVTGALSSARLTLRAFYEVTDQDEQEVFLNVLTHLSYNRVQALLAADVAFPDAITQAEKEVRDILPIEAAAVPAATQLNILSGQTGSEYLLGISSLLAQTAAIGADTTQNVDATLQELINTISSGVATEGELDQETKDKLAQAEKQINIAQVEKKLQERLDLIGSDASVPSLEGVVDSEVTGTDGDDGDGSATSEPGGEDPIEDDPEVPTPNPDVPGEPGGEVDAGVPEIPQGKDCADNTEVCRCIDNGDEVCK